MNNAKKLFKSNFVVQTPVNYLETILFQCIVGNSIVRKKKRLLLSSFNYHYELFAHRIKQSNKATYSFYCIFRRVMGLGWEF